MVTDHEIHPKWVLVEGKLYNVSEFAHLKPALRPAATCPVCQHPVTLKLGKRRAHHYAHQPDVICITTQPETALHLNVKCYIYKQLLQTDKIVVEQRCSNGCGKISQWVWLEGWERVEVEYAINEFRPDIVLIQNEQTIGAIEIAVTHRVEEGKKEYFTAQNIKWIEIEAKESIYQGEEAWSAEKPLPFSSHHPPLDRWTCEDCRNRQEKERKKQEYQEHNYTDIYAAMMVDFYFRSGKKYRQVYYVMKQVRNNECVRIWVKTRDNKVIKQVDGPITKEALRELNWAVTQELGIKRKQSAIVDKFMEWQPWMPGKKFVARDLDRFPFRYFWDDQKHKWISYSSRVHSVL